MNLFDIFSTPSHSIIFIDARVSLCQVETIDLEPNTEIVFLDLEQDGIEQITRVLADKQGIQKLHIVGLQNRNEASLQLGLAQFNIHTLETYTGELFQWRKALSTSCEVILCGLNIIPESMLHKFMQQLAKITGAQVGTFVSFTDISKCANDQSLVTA